MANIESLYQHFLNHPTICTDTRNIVDGCLFFALKGDKFDANTFATQAINQGAAYAIIDNETYLTGDRCILVADVLTTLQDLARHHRNQLSIPVIGLTGSNGKTTTKELIKAVLSQKYQTFATKGNLNNHIGVPLSILSLTSKTEIAVIEMGANHQKEIEFLCGIAQPTHGLITNIGMAHLDGFGGFEGVKKGKAELFAYLKAHEGFAFINRNNPYLMEMSEKANLNKIIYYGTEEINTVYGRLIKSDPFIELSWSSKSGSFNTEAQLTGTYNFENILAAICIGQFFEVSPDEINTGLAGYAPNNNRSQITKTASNTVICDFYNANPSSMAAALTNIEHLSSNNKTVIIGDMFELGQESAMQHKLIIEQAEKLQVNTLIFIGKYFYEAKDTHKGNFFNTPAEAEAFLKVNPINNSLVLLKGSRGMALEQLLPLL
ncbi:UDP-N-acetylmuramoyl-tripeptide--D-alanyl-D-alanine ligase [Pedobacter nyackensis]|uniref:UDP-N-acetylmuramoyl-tripeptide--D-alanyl-D-alanine ligase n=1 Tax=Pedobacter nyackensis TaxID=475255 RepID=A0A1W2BLU0_9SPHI|nr:UDP-N-acetylmuramoyl-tripeptide--D-alanyl-D-alanine ligase [Pedobacter nyackensis]SMC73871.1 UDP-N-acetylmuramoyl-tripeptide--D-alanyl-D-alanine ligase [Pedobacter nyackensis]